MQDFEALNGLNLNRFWLKNKNFSLWQIWNDFIVNLIIINSDWNSDWLFKLNKVNDTPNEQLEFCRTYDS